MSGRWRAAVGSYVGFLLAMALVGVLALTIWHPLTVYGALAACTITYTFTRFGEALGRDWGRK